MIARDEEGDVGRGEGRGGGGEETSLGGHGGGGGGGSHLEGGVRPAQQ